jgi:hypothetical protein
MEEAHRSVICDSAGAVEGANKKKTGLALPRLTWRVCEMRARQHGYFPSEMVKSTEPPGLPKAATVTVLIPWNKADEISIVLDSPLER